MQVIFDVAKTWKKLYSNETRKWLEGYENENKIAEKIISAPIIH